MRRPTAVVLLKTGSLQGTVIVMVQTSDGYWIGADGARGRLKSDAPLEAVCKIHQSNGWIILKSGASQSWDRFGADYSVDEQVKKIFEDSSSSQQLKAELVDVFVNEETEFIRWYISELDPSTLDESDPLRHIFTYPMQVEKVNEQVRAITIIGYEAEQLINLSLLTAPISNRDTGNLKFPYSFAVYRDGWSPTKFELGPMTLLSYPILPPPRPTHSAEWIVNNPRKAIEEVLKAAHDRDPGHAGPPYAIIHVTTNPKLLPKKNSFGGSKHQTELNG